MKPEWYHSFYFCNTKFWVNLDHSSNQGRGWKEFTIELKIDPPNWEWPRLKRNRSERQRAKATGTERNGMDCVTIG